MSNFISMSFSVPLELSIQMEEFMENSGLNRSELIRVAVTEYFKSQKEAQKLTNILENTHEEVLNIKEMINQLLKN